jgi:hypothetical protein
MFYLLLAKKERGDDSLFDLPAGYCVAEFLALNTVKRLSLFPASLQYY